MELIQLGTIWSSFHCSHQSQPWRNHSGHWLLEAPQGCCIHWEDNRWRGVHTIRKWRIWWCQRKSNFQMTPSSMSFSFNLKILNKNNIICIHVYPFFHHQQMDRLWLLSSITGLVLSLLQVIRLQSMSDCIQQQPL